MPKLILITLLNSLIIMTVGGFAYAQKPPQKVQQDTVDEKTATQREVPKQVVNISLKDERLSIELVNASLGESLRSIAQKAGFSIEGNSRAFSQKITTKFNDLDIDIGIIRLFSLVKENNYLINYDTKGSISKIKVYDTGSLGSVPPTSVPTTGSGAIPFKTWRSRRLRNSLQPAAPSPPSSNVPHVPQPETPVPQPETPVPQPEIPDLGENAPSEED